jgi:hypothetical protein
MKKFKILDLFSGTCSVKKALDTMDIEYEYYGIDIYSPEEENLILDLSQDDIVDKLVAALPKGWIPDFIWNSPVCNKFSTVHRCDNGNYYYEKTSTGLKPRENFNIRLPYNYENKDFEQAKLDAKLHLKLVNNMLEIIDYFDCDFIIENPLNSFIERLMPFEYKKNRVDYCRYGFDYQKPTAIYSRDLLGLKTCNHNRKHKLSVQDMGDYARKSSVPPLLIKQILNIFLV